MTSPSSRPPPGQGHRRGAAATNDVVPAAITFAALGLDISQAEVVACLLLADGSEVVPRWTIPNSLPGAQALAERVQALAKAQGIKELRIGLEATGLYWWHLACFLKETPALTEVHQTIYVFNPALVQGLKRVYADAGKTDRLDAFFIAERLRVGRLPQPFQPNLVYAPLQRLTRFRAHLGQTLAREKNYCLALLFLPFSAFGQEAPFDDLFSPTSLGILETFTTEELAQASLEDLATFVQQHGRGRFADPRQVATTLKQAACHSYRLAPGLDEPLKLILTTTLATIRTLQGQLRAVDRTIAEAHRRSAGSPTHLGLGPWPRAGLDCWEAFGDRRYLPHSPRCSVSQVCGAGLEAAGIGGLPGGRYCPGQNRQSVSALLPDRSCQQCTTALPRISRLLQRQAGQSLPSMPTSALWS